MTLQSQTASAYAVEIEKQLIEVFSGLLSAECAPHRHPGPPRILIDYADLAEAFGSEKLAYLVASRAGFKLSDDGLTWSRLRGPNTEEEVWVFADLNQARIARAAIDPDGITSGGHHA
ncbi:MAG: hypothetical protein V4753_09875 [Pseudomonadota bacterium]